MSKEIRYSILRFHNFIIKKQIWVWVIGRVLNMTFNNIVVASFIGGGREYPKRTKKMYLKVKL